MSVSIESDKILLLILRVGKDFQESILGYMQYQQAKQMQWLCIEQLVVDD